ncbi:MULTISPECIES: hypothetical protein [unclassified Streptomyces]|uniref:hypothetical protein n=1 Tax=unclassified Streptomyces TaxID=2593676 RepID=UPI0033B78101
MSCHTLTPHKSAPPGRMVLIGWDRLGTYYLSVTDQQGDTVRDVFFAGADLYDISEASTVAELASAYAPLPEELRQRLIDDRASEGYRCPACLGHGTRLLPACCGETPCSPCRGTGKIQCAHGFTLASGQCPTCTSEAETPAEPAGRSGTRRPARRALLNPA